MSYIGVDLHKTNFVACFLDEQERITLQPFALSPKGVATCSRRVTKADRVAVEAAPTVAFFSERVRLSVQEVSVVNPYQFAVIARSKKKTDRHDAILLARCLKWDWLPTVPMPAEPIRQLRTLLEARDGLGELRTKLKHMGHALLARNGMATGRAAFTSAQSRQHLLKLPALPAVEGSILGSIVRPLAALDPEVDALEEAIITRGKALPGVARVLQVRGMNLLRALRLLAEIGDIAWFTHAKQLLSSAGLAPGVRHSNDTARHGNITKRGRKRLRTLAMRAGLALSQGPATPGAECSAQKKRERGAGKALCAAARKLLTLLCVMRTKDLDYWDLEAPLYHRKLRLLKRAA